MKKPLVLCILDGCGLRESSDYNAFKNANKPTFDKLFNNYPHSILEASGTSVGLPDNQMGNSEVGHMNIGAGRICYQPQERINQSIKTKEFYNNPTIKSVIEHTKKNHSNLHIMGLVSNGGIHSRIEHLLALLDLCKKEQVPEVYLHLFTDGRDTDIHSAPTFIKKVQDKIQENNLGKIVTISGRFYAMDRDNNYDRIKLAYDAIVRGIGQKYSEPETLFKESYAQNITDEFIKPTIITNNKLETNDGIIVFNYRPDRLREMFSAITNPNTVPFDTKPLKNISLVSMMPINETVNGKSAFLPLKLDNTLGVYLSSFNLSQLRIAETEKYAHVTYFFDGGKEINIPNAHRILINSPKVETYDLKPEMSAQEITERLLEELDKDYLDVVILNYANGDMVGHTGNYEAAVKAIEYVDQCLKKLYDKVCEKNGLLIVTSDHGNCDVMRLETGAPCTTHTTNPVPFIIANKDYKLKKEGKLSDIAPTILELLNLPIPSEITGNSLLEREKNK